jgi:hypothetical protein
MRSAVAQAPRRAQNLDVPQAIAWCYLAIVWSKTCQLCVTVKGAHGNAIN